MVHRRRNSVRRIAERSHKQEVQRVLVGQHPLHEVVDFSYGLGCTLHVLRPHVGEHALKLSPGAFFVELDVVCYALILDQQILTRIGVILTLHVRHRLKPATGDIAPHYDTLRLRIGVDVHNPFERLGVYLPRPQNGLRSFVHNCTAGRLLSILEQVEQRVERHRATTERFAVFIHTASRDSSAQGTHSLLAPIRPVGVIIHVSREHIAFGSKTLERHVARLCLAHSLGFFSREHTGLDLLLQRIVYKLVGLLSQLIELGEDALFLEPVKRLVGLRSSQASTTFGEVCVTFGNNRVALNRIACPQKHTEVAKIDVQFTSKVYNRVEAVALKKPFLASLLGRCKLQLTRGLKCLRERFVTQIGFNPRIKLGCLPVPVSKINQPVGGNLHLRANRSGCGFY